MRYSMLVLFLCLLLAACIPQNTITSKIPHERYTEAVKTVAVQLTQNARLTPSVTPTETPQPTATITNTPEPTPTVPTPTATWHFEEKGEIITPILVYYHIADDASEIPGQDAGSQYMLPKDEFQQQLAEIKQRGYESIPITVLTNAMLFGTEMPQRPIVFTFDSTAEVTYNNAFLLMQEAGFTGTIFLTVNQIGQENMLTVAQINEMIAAGWQIGSSGMNGYNLTSDHSLLSDEISGSRLALQELFDTSVTVFAYPYGRTDDVILPRVSAWGYEAAVGLNWYDAPQHNAGNIYYLSRYEVLAAENHNDLLEYLPW